jgi:transposase
MSNLRTRPTYPKELRERTVRMVFERTPEFGSQWAAIVAVADKFGFTSESLRRWVREAERNDDPVVRLATDERERLKLLERENRELRQANEILKKASAYFAQAALDRQSKT